MELKKILKLINIDLTLIQEEKFEKYYNFLISENKKYNLTAITERNDVFIKHFLDSLLPFDVFKPNSKVLDVGSGAGFPSIPLAIIRDDIEFTLIDSVGKKVNFLNQVAELLDLKNVKAIHTRCEDFANVSRETFDFVVARAVAPMNVLCEYLIPFAKVGGRIVVYKGSNYLEELQECENVLKLFHVKQFDVKKYEIVINESKTTEKVDKNTTNTIILGEKTDKNTVNQKNMNLKLNEDMNKNLNKNERIKINNDEINNICNNDIELNNYGNSIIINIIDGDGENNQKEVETIYRNIIVLDKSEKTNPKYPRGNNKPRLNPLK